MTQETIELERLRTALDELRLINNLLTKISQVREVHHIMSVLLGELVAMTESDQGVINLVSRMKEDDLSTVVRNANSKSQGIPYKVSELIAGWVLSNRILLNVPDLDHDTRVPGMSSEGGAYKSVLCCPMVVKGDVIGLITLTRSQTRGPFHDGHCRLIGVIASQAGQLLANARLCEELAQKNELLEMSRQQLREENSQLRTEIGTGYGFENIVGKSAPIKQVLILASKFAVNDSPVLITGETGTGKDLIARAIHFNSLRKGKPFVIKNCGIKTETLLEAELFGYRKGAFTGADRDKPGLFKEADGGTIFLDEIGDAPVATQAAILRVIQQGEIRPIGANKTEFVNVRVLSATNHDLKEEIKKGNFREDLYYRLNTFCIDLPPLRERTEDIPLLVHYFLSKLRVKLNNDQLRVSPAAMDILIRFSWPGNIRQLEHELERAAVVCGPSGEIGIGDLSPDLQALSSGSDSSEAESPHGALREAVEKLERGMIASALAEHNANLVHSAEALGLTRKGLKDKMARYGLRAERE